MSRRLARLALALMLALAAAPGAAVAGGGHPSFEPGAAGIGDPYFPLDGNGGYDVGHYVLNVRYDPATDVLKGVTTIKARATQNLSAFNLDLVGLTVRSITVNGRRTTWSREGQELTVTPRRGLRAGRRFTVVVRYDGVPQTQGEFEPYGLSGFMHTDDGTVVAGQPQGAATWFPANDHPLDTASYTFKITVPEGLEAVANGVLTHRHSRRGRTTWVWEAREPMASYLTTATIGEFDLRSYRADGIRYWDAIDPDLLERGAPRTGGQFAIAQVGDAAYKRLTRTISVPASGSRLSFWIDRDTEAAFDFVFVEAHRVGSDDWTTLPDLNGHTTAGTGFGCPGWLGVHPFLTHYQTDNGDGTCAATGTTGAWWAASGSSDGYEQWAVDLSPYAGGDVEVSITYASDPVIQLDGVFVDDIVVTAGGGSTSFEPDADPLDGWTVPGPPPGTEANVNDWIVGTTDDAPTPVGEIAARSLARQPEIIEFLSGIFGPYPFSAAGGIVDDSDAYGFALETQTRPVYTKLFFANLGPAGDAVVVHELAHQWAGNSLALAAWQHIWLNEGFATYAEWLWSEREGLGTPQEIFDSFAADIPADDPFWALTIGDPGPDALFDGAVYIRGAMTLHALRLAVGDDDFFRIVRTWARSRAGENVTTSEFIALAERISGQELDALFTTWLFTAGKPAGIEPPAAAATSTTSGAAMALLDRVRRKR